MRRECPLSFDDLCINLRSPRWWIFERATFLLSLHYPAQSASLIIEEARHRHPESRQKALYNLAQFSRGKAAEAVLPYLQDEEIWVRCLVVEMLPNREEGTRLLLTCLQ
jgi:hypothetical protein